MPEINQNIEMWAGEDVVIYVTLTNIDIEGLIKIKWQLSETADSEIIEVAKYIDNIGRVDEDSDGITVYPLTNKIKIIIDSADTIDMGGSRYFHEVRIWDNDNKQSTIMTGRIKINATTYSQEEGS
jgi:hypothetical protein